MRAFELRAILERVPDHTLITVGVIGGFQPNRHVTEVRRMHGRAPSQLVIFTSWGAPDHRSVEPRWWLSGPSVQDAAGLEAILDPEVPAELRGRI